MFIYSMFQCIKDEVFFHKINSTFVILDKIDKVSKLNQVVFIVSG